MTPTAPNESFTVQLSAYQFTTLRDGEYTLYRGTSDVLDPILLLTPAESAREGAVKRLEHELALAPELESQWAARPILLTRYDGRPALVLEDPGGESLDCVPYRPLDVANFLHLAIALSAAIRGMHERRLIHLDIKPANVIVDVARRRAWLTGFGIASRLPREHRLPEPPEVIAGTLAYMAPEQTGRMNRSVDSRSDLYAMGVTLYELLTGALPFAATDPIELIHSHIARQPISPGERSVATPAQISAVLMKLLAKTAEERYQTAAGVEADFRKCLAAWDATGRIGNFALGKHDAPERLLIPEKLYGRESETAALLAAFDRVVTSGESELVLVSGYSGIGKSSVVNELDKLISLPRGIFISGKFDQRLRGIPYATVAQAFDGLIRRILKGRDEDICRWRDAVRDAVGNLGGLLTELIPTVGQLIGPLPPVPVLSPLDTQARFQSVFQRFIGVFARREHPLVVFMDDLQWLDPGTLRLMECFTTHRDTCHLLLIGAYRDNEVDSTHALMATLEAIRKTGARIDRICLGPLHVGDVSQLLCDALHCESAPVQPLAELVHGKTGGNPFFVGQFLASLAEEGLLAFDPRSRSWTWDLDGIATKSLVGDVADLVIGRLRRLPDAAQEALKLFSCLGSHADFWTVALVHGASTDGLRAGTGPLRAPSVLHASLRAAVRAGAIFSQQGLYRFMHDRVQEAAYALIPEQSRAGFHLRIGRLLVGAMTEEKVAEKIFDIVNQFNLGAPLVSEQIERERIAGLNLQAGRKAKVSSAYASASRYLSAGMDVLTQEGWLSCYELALSLRLERAECEILNANFEEAARLIEELLGKGRTRVDRAAAYRLRMVLHLMHGQNALAVHTALECLRMFDLELPDSPTVEHVQTEYEDILRLLGGRAIGSLVQVPLTDDREMQAVMNVLATAWLSAYFLEKNYYLSQLMVSRIVKLTQQHGVCDSSIVGYGALSVFLGTVLHRPEDGDAFGQLAVDAAHRHGFNAQKAGANFLMQMAILWTRPIGDALSCLKAAIQSAQETGEIVYACYSLEHRLTDRMARGDPLDEVWAESVKTLDFVRKSGFRHVIAVVSSIQAFVQVLRGRPGGEPSIDEAALEAEVIEIGIPVVISFYWILQLQRQYLFGNAEAALKSAAMAKPFLWSVRCHIQSADYCFYHSLALIAVLPTATPERQTGLRDALEQHLASLHRWANSCPSTFSHKHALVAAEVACLDGRDKDAMSLFEQAIRSAADHGFVQDEALACELAGQFYACCGLERVTHQYMREARDAWIRWGAAAKAAQLDEHYPQIRRHTLRAPLPTIEASIDQLDLATVLRMSQAIAGEIVSDKLIEKLMVLVLEHTGADRGLLICPQEDGLHRIEAEAKIDRNTVRVRFLGATATLTEIPVTVLERVIRTKNRAILDDALAHGPCVADEYVVRKQVRSVLCLPLIKQTRLIGVLYLENSLVAHVFTPARIAVLELLSSQAAISLENARLYSDLVNENRDRQSAQEALKASEASLNEAQRISHTGSWRWTPETGEVASSAELLRIFGFDPETQLSYAEYMKRIIPDDRPSVEQLLVTALQERARFEQEYRIVLPDGAIRHIQKVGQPDITESGVIEFVGTIMDVTEHRQAEEALRDAQTELARVARLTMMGELVASIAHEINQPLGGIATNGTACLRWLSREQPDLDRARAATTRIVKDAHRAGDIIRGLRALMAKTGPQLTKLDINDVIGEVLTLTRTELQKRAVMLRTNLAPGLGQIVGDRVQLQQVLLNLIINGVEAMATNTGDTRVLTIVSDPTEVGGIHIAVEDTGTGLDPLTVDRIFDPFFTTKSVGMGMGLSICRSIIEAHGGRLWAAPNGSHGAVFQFTLPNHSS